METYRPLPVPSGDISDEGLAFARSVRSWAERELMSRRRELGEDYPGLLEPALGTLLLELGLQRHAWPEALGGDGPGAAAAALDHALVLEQVGRADVGLGLSLGCGMALAAAVTAEQQGPAPQILADLFLDPERPAVTALVLPRLAEGPGEARSLLWGRGLQARVTADPEGEGGGWLLSMTGARPLGCGDRAALLGVVARIPGQDQAGLFLVPGDASGLRRADPPRRLGLAACAGGELTHDGLRLPGSALALGDEQGLLRLRSWLQLHGASAASGALLATAEILGDWAENRVIKGRGQLLRDNPLAAAVMAEVANCSHLSRLLVLDLARLLGGGGDPGEAGLAAAAGGITRQVLAWAEHGTHRAMELMGSAGYAREWQLERYWRDVKALQLELGGGPLDRLEPARQVFGARLPGVAS